MPRITAGLIMTVLLSAPSVAAAQGIPAMADSVERRPDSLGTVRELPGSLTDAPADSADGPLLYLPGVAGSLSGISIRGSAPSETGTLVNGIDVTPGMRGPAVALPTNAAASAWVVTGPASARTAAGRSLQFEIAGAPDSSGARLRYFTDRLSGASSLGFNRFELATGLSRRTFRVFAAGTLTGQKAADFGTDARSVPIFAPAGLDTSITFPGESGDSITEDVVQWAATRGNCDTFSKSTNAGIADNYGLDCTGDRTPGTAQSAYSVAVSAQLDLNRTAKLEFLGLKSRSDAREFDYRSIRDPANLRGDQQLASAYTVTLSGQLGQGPMPGAYRIGVSRQQNQLMAGPLTAESELKTRDPSLGLMLSGLGFRWDFTSFPVDSQLVDNYRAHRTTSRITPYDLLNVDQYNLVDPYRDGPYATSGFFERGGPVGLLDLQREKRTLFFGDASWRTNRNSVLSVGGSYTRYDIASYASQLTSLVFSDIYIEKPASGALYAEQRFTYGKAELSAGVRYDFFSSNAERPAALDTLPFIPGTSTPNPTYGQYQQYPAISSYGAPGQTIVINGRVLPLVSTIKDRRHSGWSPALRGALQLGRDTRLRGGIVRELRMPDLALVYAGVNTDLNITNIGQVFGTDLDFTRSWREELGLTQSLGRALALDIVGYHRSSDSVPATLIQGVRNPLRNNTPTSLLRYATTAGSGITGGEIALSFTSPWLSAAAGYRHQGTSATDFTIGGIWNRADVFTTTVAFHAPPELRHGLFSRASLWAGLRVAGGMRYVKCFSSFGVPPGDLFAEAGEPCPIFSGGLITGPTRGEKHLDLRFSKALTPGPYAPRLFVDVRNLFNFRNSVRQYQDTLAAAQGKLEFIADEQAAYHDEATRNGASASNGDINLAFPDASCAGWVNVGGSGAAPNCIALKRAEARFGNGDGVFTTAEQAATAGALFGATSGTDFLGTPRRIRLGIEMGI